MALGSAAPGSNFRIAPVSEVYARWRGQPPPLVLDVRRRAAFREDAQGIPGALAVVLDDDPVRLPDAPRERPVVVYCLCRGEASSTRVARWLVQEGYRDVWVLQGGLGAWREPGHPLEPISLDAGRGHVRWLAHVVGAPPPAGETAARVDDPFHSRLEMQSFLGGRALPARRRMAVCFVDMTDSTRLLARHATERVLVLVQAFMEIVVEVGALHCGDVHDFEGDGALLYFAGVGEALPAAFEIRRRLLERRRALPALPLPRLALDEGPVVVGLVGSRFRRAVALVGPCVPRAARILKLAPPGGIVATARVVELAGETDPDLAGRFRRLPVSGPLKGFEGPAPGLHLAPPAALEP